MGNFLLDVGDINHIYIVVEGVKYLPEPIEIVDDNIFTHMIQSLILCNSLECEYIEKVYEKCLEKVK